MSETSSILSSISSCCSHDTAINLDSSSVNNNNDVNNNNNNIQQTSLQYILNQNQNDDVPLDYWEFNNNCEEYDDDEIVEEEEEEDYLNPGYNINNHYYYGNSYYPSSHLNSEYHHHQYNQYISQDDQCGKLVPPPPPPPMEMDLLENEQILSSEEFNSIFESFTAVVEGQDLNNNNNNNNNNFNFLDDGCFRGVNCNNGLLDDEQLSKALGAITMI
jgi:hypothetical protein